MGKKGVVRDGKVHQEVIAKVVSCACRLGYQAENLEYSPVKGPEGNIEYLVHLTKAPAGADAFLREQVEDVVRRAHEALDKKR